MFKLSSSLLAFALAVAAPAQDKEDTGKIRKAADAAVQSSDWATAIANFQKLTEVDPKNGSAWHMLGYSLHASGDLDAALKVHLKAAEFPEVAPTATYNAACVYALKGKKDDALKTLEKAAAAGFNRPEHLANDSDMDPLRDDPRFKEIVAKMGKNASNSPAVQVYAGNFERKLARMVLFGNGGSLGAISITYGQPQWQAKWDETVESPKFQNRRWRFGRDEWTTLDVSVPAMIGDQELAPGVYYLTLERRDGKFIMAAIDPASVHQNTIDPFVAHLTTGGTEVPLSYEKTDDVAERLEIELQAAKGHPGKGELVIHFGGHKLSAPVLLKAKTAKTAVVK